MSEERERLVCGGIVVRPMTRGTVTTTGAPSPAGGDHSDERSGRRRHVVVSPPRGLALEGGGRLATVRLAYETWGRLDEDRANAVLVCHALTGDSHVAGEGGWWPAVVGPGLAIDTERWFVVCVNVIGGCQGSTGPSDIDPATGRRYASSFPVVSMRDIVRTQARLADRLGIERWASVVGGSMGGMQALEWAVTYPGRVRSVAAVATAAAASAQQIAWSFVGRRAIELDPAFTHSGDEATGEGDGTDEGRDGTDDGGAASGGRATGGGPHRGLALARAIAMIHYRSDVELESRFGRQSVEDVHPFRLEHRFDVERYLDYQGEKLVRRFDAHSYVVLNKAMDLHDVGRGRGGVRRALGRVCAPALVASVTTDALYPPHQQQALAEMLRDVGTPVQWAEIDSPNGHDGFLTHSDQLIGPLSHFLHTAPRKVP